MKKILLILILFSVSINLIQGQVTQVTFSPGPGAYWQGESTQINFEFKNGATTVQPPAGCSFSVSYVGGGIQSILHSGTNRFFQVYWGAQPSNANAFSVSLNCSNNANNNTFFSGFYSVMSLTGLNPVKTAGSTSVPVCNPGTVTYTIDEVSIPNGGARKASAYQWTIPNGWKFPDGSTSNGTPKLISGSGGRSISVIPDCNNGGSVLVRAYTNTEGRGTPHYSNAASWSVSRTPSVQLTIPSQIYCGVPFTATITSLSCVNSSNYTWVVPSGWQMSGSGNTRTITPSSTTIGTVTASIALPGGCTISRSLAKQPLIQPNVTGGPILYTGSPITLTNYPPSSTVTWSIISNSGLFTTATRNGSGNVANLVPINSSASGSATIRFTISGGLCNYPPKDFVFWVGRPNFQLYYLTNSFYYGVEQGPGGGFEVKPFTLVDMRPALDTQLADILEYEWQLSGDYYSVISSSNEVMSFISTSNLNSQVYVYLRMRNAAGWSNRPFASIYTRDEGYEPELVYPSPVENELTVQSYEVDEGMNQNRALNFVPATIRILNSNGTQVIEVKDADPVEKIDVSRLEKGYYIVQIIKGDKVSSRKIQIK